MQAACLPCRVTLRLAAVLPVHAAHWLPQDDVRQVLAGLKGAEVLVPAVRPRCEELLPRRRFWVSLASNCGRCRKRRPTPRLAQAPARPIPRHCHSWRGAVQGGGAITSVNAGNEGAAQGFKGASGGVVGMCVTNAGTGERRF